MTINCSTAATILPGSDTLAALTAVAADALSPSDLVDAVIAAERLISHVNGLQVRLLAELGRPHRCGDVTQLVAALVEKAGVGRGSNGEVDDDEVAELTADRSIGVAAAELAAVLDWSPVTARIRINQSMRMMSALPATAAALEQGRIDVGRARMIVDSTSVLAAELCGAIERRILPLVKGRSKGRLETLVDREVIAADPAAAENRRLAAIKDRSVTHRPDKDGMGVITALLPAESAVLVFTLIDLIATANKGLDGRSVDQRRADAVADIADELLTYGFVDLEGLVARANRATTATAGSPETAADEQGRTAAPADPAADAAEDEAKSGSSTDADSGMGDGAADVSASAGDGVVPDGVVPDGVVPDGVVPDGVVPDGVIPDESAPLDDSATPKDSATPEHRATPEHHATPEHRATPEDSVAACAPTGSAGADVRAATALSGDAGVDRVGRLARAVTRHGRRPHLTVTGAWTTLAGLDDLPGHLDGHGTITAELFRAIARSWGTLTAVGVDPATGTATAVGGLTYRTSQRICDQVITLSGTCRAAGCRMPAAKCDLDHVQAFDHAHPAAGGRTTLVNQLPECRFHHMLKHHTGWTPHLRPDMTVVWTTNTGHTATSHPREFTMPGEWQRNTIRCGPPPQWWDRDEERATDAVRPAADPAVTDPADSADIFGPVVAGPTIPVVPAGAGYEEPHTELEDPATVPDPGGIGIQTYRILRADARQQALRRIGRITALTGSAHPAPAAAERQALDRNYRTGQRGSTFGAVDHRSDPAAAPLIDLSRDPNLCPTMRRRSEVTRLPK